MVRIRQGLDYLFSGQSFLKAAEIISLLVATGVVGFFLNKAPDGFFSVVGKKAYLQIFVTAVAIGWILAVAMFSSFIAGLHERFSATNWWICVAIVSVVWATFLLIASALLAVAAAHYYQKKITISSSGIFFSGSGCDWLLREKVDSQCGDLIGGAVSGFTAAALFAVDASIYFSMYFALAFGTTATAPAVPT